MDESAETPQQQEQQPNDAEMRAALEAEFRQIKVEDLIKQSAASLINVGAFKAGLISGSPEDVELEQAKRSIDAAGSLLEQVAGDDDIGPLKDALSQLQLAYAQLGSGASETAEEAGPDTSNAASSADSGSKLWVPGQ